MLSRRSSSSASRSDVPGANESEAAGSWAKSLGCGAAHCLYNLFRSSLSSSVHNDVTPRSEPAVPAGLQLPTQLKDHH
jgi:hypothetical protein